MKIFFTRRAEQNYHAIRDYIIKKWGDSVADTFEEKTRNFLDILAEFPEIGTVEVKDKQIYGFQLSSQIRLFYRIKGEKIIILSLFDVRQNPKKKKF